MSSGPIHERLRFKEFSLERLPNGRCRAHVLLSWKDEESFAGDSEGLSSQAGELRCAAQACLMALGKSVEGKMQFELLGVKAVRAFDANVVIVSIGAQGNGNGQRLVGVCLTPDDAPRGAALAVLNATNRILGNQLFMR